MPRSNSTKGRKKNSGSGSSEESRLWHNYHTHGCQRSREALILRHQPLIGFVMRRHFFGYDYQTREELQQEAQVALIKCVDGFNPTHNSQAQFSTYATRAIFQRLLRFIHLQTRGPKTFELRQDDDTLPTEPDSANDIINRLDYQHQVSCFPPFERTIIDEHLINRQTFNEISTLLGYPIPTIRYRFYRSMHHLRKAAENGDINPPPYTPPRRGRPSQRNQDQ